MVNSIFLIMAVDDEKSNQLPAELALPPPPEPQIQQFDCPRQGCKSKIEINDDICRYLVMNSFFTVFTSIHE